MLPDVQQVVIFGVDREGREVQCCLRKEGSNSCGPKTRGTPEAVYYLRFVDGEVALSGINWMYALGG